MSILWPLLVSKVFPFYATMPMEDYVCLCSEFLCNISFSSPYFKSGDNDLKVKGYFVSAVFSFMITFVFEGKCLNNFL